MGRGLQACSYGENPISYGEYQSGSSKPMAEIVFLMPVSKRRLAM
jgi:hypothetical protein